MELNAMMQEMSEYIVFGSTCFRSSGFYNGKAGASLALFEASRILKSSFFEEEAYLLLQESLLTQTTDMSFRNGISGVGFVLNFLVRENFIDRSALRIFQERDARIRQYVQDVSIAEIVKDFSIIESFMYIWTTMDNGSGNIARSLSDRLWAKCDEAILECSGDRDLHRAAMCVDKYLHLCLREKRTVPKEVQDEAVWSYSISKDAEGEKQNSRFFPRKDEPNRGMSYMENLCHWTEMNCVLLAETLGGALCYTPSLACAWVETKLLSLDLREFERHLVRMLSGSPLRASYGLGLSRLVLSLCLYRNTIERRDSSALRYLFS